MRRKIRMFRRQKEKFHNKMVQCYNYNKFGHFASDCWSNRERKGQEANIARGDSDDEPVLFMSYESEGEKNGRPGVYGQ